MENKAIADKLREMALFYEMEGVSFKPAAYERAAEAIDGTSDRVSALYQERGRDALDDIPGIGDAIARHIEQLLKTGTFPEYEKFRKRYPVDLLALTSVDDVGPKRAKLFYKALKVKTLDDLERAALAGKIAALPGLGKKTEETILKGVRRVRRAGGRHILGRILPLVRRIEDELRRVPGVRHVSAAGSVRRMQETVGDLDILVTTAKPEEAMQWFVAFPEVAEVIEHGPTKTVVRLKSGMQADVRVVDDESFGAALQYFTGDKEHNIVVRKMAIAKGLKLNEYGIWKGSRRIASKTETDVYRALGLPYIEPEIRTASGEIEAARRGKLPPLIPYGSLKGDLQVQTSWTDGAAAIAEMAIEAEKRGLSYIAITDHTRSLAMTGGLDEKGLARQAKEIDALNAKRGRSGSKFRVLKGAEVNIAKDGSLDIADAALAKLDVVGVAVHSHFALPRAEQTKRVIAALKHPHVDVLFHPTGRLIHDRDPIDIDMEAVLKAARSAGVAIEIDAYPERSDLKDVHVRMATALGVKLAIDSDAHHPAHFSFLDLGVAIARRGWAEKKDVLNARPLAALLAWLRTPKARRR